MIEHEIDYNISLLFILVCALYIFGSITVGIIAKHHGHKFILGFTWSICFTPVIALLVVLRIKKNNREF